MKKIIFAVLIIVLVLTMSSCESENKVDATQFMKHYSSDDVKDLETFSKEFFQIFEYRTEEFIECDSEEVLSRYVAENNASEEFKNLYQTASKVEMLPILGPYFEYTSLKCCLFYNEEVLTGVRIVSVGITDKTVSVVSEPIFPDSVTFQGRKIEKYIYEQKLECEEYLPEFQIKGIKFLIVRNRLGLFGAPSENEPIKWIYVPSNPLYQTMGYEYVEPFTTIEEGHNKYEEFWDFRAKLHSSLPIIEVEAGFSFGMYAYQDVCYLDFTEEEKQFLYDSDWWIEIPLLDKHGNAKNCTLFLLYRKDVLISELLLVQNEETGRVYPGRQIVSEKDPSTGKYIGLSEIKYITEVTKLLNSAKNSDIKGIGFDGEKYVLFYN